MRFDVVTFGETMLRLSPDGFQTLEQAETYQVRCAGTESNVAVGLARLGLRVAWFSRLVDNPLGRKVAASLRGHGVDVSHVIWTGQGRIGIAFMEIGVPPRPSEVVYDRAGSVFSQMQESDVDWSLFAQARHLHVTGITPALGPSCSACVSRAVRRARESGATLSFDVNYRRKLWKPEAAAATLGPLMAGVDVLFLTSEDAAELFGIRGEPETAVRLTAERYRSRWTVLTLGAQGAAALAGDQFALQPGYPTNVVDRIGAGDAFVAGFLFGYFQGELRRALQLGLAMAAIKMTTPGDLTYTTLRQVEELIAGVTPSVRR